MKIDDLLNEEYLDFMAEISANSVLSEASKRTEEKKKRKTKERRKKEREAIDPDERFGITPKADAIKRAHRTFDWEDNNPKFKDGRERLITAVIHIVQKNGGSLGRQEARDYVYKKYKQWASKSPKVKWILDLEEKAKALGFNPRDYKDQKPGQSAGKEPEEHSGRAKFFTTLMNAFANHFLKQQGLEQKHKQAHMEKPTDEEKKKINIKEKERIYKLFHPKEK